MTYILYSDRIFFIYMCVYIKIHEMKVGEIKQNAQAQDHKSHILLFFFFAFLC